MAGRSARRNQIHGEKRRTVSVAMPCVGVQSRTRSKIARGRRVPLSQRPPSHLSTLLVPHNRGASYRVTRLPFINRDGHFILIDGHLDYAIARAPIASCGRRRSRSLRFGEIDKILNHLRDVESAVIRDARRRDAPGRKSRPSSAVVGYAVHS